MKHEEIIRDLEKVNVDGKGTPIVKKSLLATDRCGLHRQRSQWLDKKSKEEFVEAASCHPICFHFVQNWLCGTSKSMTYQLTTLRYADDTALIANSRENLRELLQALEEESEERS